MGAKLFVFFLIAIMLGSGWFLINRGSSQFKILDFSQVKLDLPSLMESFNIDSASSSANLEYKPRSSYKPLPSIQPTASPASTPTQRPTIRPTIAPTKKPVVQAPIPAVAPQRDCYRYKITHLDGSTSNLCYSAGDYNELSNLGFELSSATSNYNFYLSVVKMYQESYDKYGAKLYLDARDRAQKDADEAKIKVDQTTVKMYNVESRGF